MQGRPWAQHCRLLGLVRAGPCKDYVAYSMYAVVCVYADLKHYRRLGIGSLAIMTACLDLPNGCNFAVGVCPTIPSDFAVFRPKHPVAALQTSPTILHVSKIIDFHTDFVGFVVPDGKINVFYQTSLVHKA